MATRTLVNTVGYFIPSPVVGTSRVRLPAQVFDVGYFSRIIRINYSYCSREGLITSFTMSRIRCQVNLPLGDSFECGQSVIGIKLSYKSACLFICRD